MSDISESMRELSPLKQALLAVKDMRVRLDAVERAKTESIAIIGMGCRFPGGADNPASYWQLLHDSIDAISEVPPDRWDVDAYFDPDPDAAGKMVTRWGGFLEDVDQFSPQFFGISPREAMSMDPQQRLLLETSWQALEYANQPPEKLVGSRTGVYVGISINDYARLQMEANDLRQLDAYSGTGTTFSVAAGRISYMLGLQGPALAVDTACSSSLVAVHLACESLRANQTDLALAGGVSLMLSPEGTVYMSKARALSPDGRCKTFDAGANGYVRGEGCGVVVLKRLSDAVADGDDILALIRGTALNHDGRSSGLTVPRGAAQKAVIEAALENAGGLDPHIISYVETHGTATPLGDPIEARALAAALGKGRSLENPLAIGSVKTNIGHLEAAAGVASLLKVILALQNQEIPSQLHFREPSPHIDWASLPLQVVTKPQKWEGEHRLAGVSSFGFSGTNAHVILESAPVSETKVPEIERPFHLLAISAKDEEELSELADLYSEYLETSPDVSLAEVAHTANTGRTHFDHRLAVVAETGEQLQQKLAASNGEIIPGGRRKVAFLFTGQGAQYPDMGRKLYETQPTFRAALDQCDEMLKPHLERPLLSILYSDDEEEAALINQTAYTQPALFAIEYALAQLWRSWGIEPSAVMGHSVGEYVAACISGVFSLEDGLRLIAERGRLMQALPSSGAMASVFADEEKVAAAVAPFSEEVSVAAINGPENVVISGTETAVSSILEKLQEEGIESRRLTVSHAFHSPLMEQILDDFERVAATITYQTPRIRLISNVTGEEATGDQLTNAAYWRQHVRQPVRFAQAMETLHQRDYELFLEIGPKPILLGMGRRCLPKDVGIWLPSLRPGRDDWQQMLGSLGTLYMQGLDVDWVRFDRDYARNRLHLPTYPFQRQRYWFEATGQASRSLVNGAGHPLLGNRLLSALKEIQFETQLSLHSPSYLADRRLHERALMPPAAYLEIGLAAASDLFEIETPTIEGIVIEEPLELFEELQTIQVIVTPTGPDYASLQIFSMPNDGDAWKLMAKGRLKRAHEEPPPQTLDFETVKAKSRQVDIEDYYARLRQQGLDFGPRFQCFDELWQDGEQVLAALRTNADTRRYLLHPPLLDACCHLLGIDEQAVYSISEAERVQLIDASLEPVWCHARIKSKRQDLIEGDVFLFNESGLPVAELSGIRMERAMPDSLPQVAENYRDWIYEVEWQPKVLPNDSPAIVRDKGNWLIFADQGGVGMRLAEALAEKGEKSVTIRPQTGDSEKYEDPVDVYLPLDDPGQYHQLLRELMDEERPLRGIIHLWSLDIPSPDEAGLTALEQAQKLGTGSVLHLIQALAAAATEFKSVWVETPHLWLVTRAAQPVAAQSEANITQSPVWGLGKTIAQEYPGLFGGMIDLDPESPADETTALLEQVWFGDGEPQCAFRRGERYVARLVQNRNMLLPKNPISPRSDGAYLISGGLGDLGLLVARFLAEQGARRLILLSRSPVPPRQTWSQVAADGPMAKRLEAIRELEAIGVSVHTAAVDIGDLSQLTAFLKTYKQEGWPSIRGVVHAAGIVQDKSLEQLDISSLNAVLQPKMWGGWLLHHHLRDAPLDFFVMFSSFVSLAGSVGQGNYTAANSFLDALAHYRQMHDQVALSINWGPWAEIGMATRDDFAERRARRGVVDITPRQGLDLLARLIGQPKSQVGVMPTSPAQLRKLSPIDSPFLEELTADQDDAQMGSDPVEPIGQQLQQASSGERLQTMKAYLCQRIANVLMIDVQKLVPERSVMELGMDSLMVMELIKELDQNLGLTLYPREIFDRPSIIALAEYLLADWERMNGIDAVGTNSEITEGGETLPQYITTPLEKPARRNPRMVFLLSSPRAGSTLLRVMLAGHPGLFCPPELHLLPFNRLDEWQSQLEQNYLAEGLQRAVMELRDLDADQSQALLAEWADQELSVQEAFGFLQTWAAPRLLVDKSPSYAIDIEILERAELLFEDAQYIHLIRHPYAVIDSFVKSRMDKLFDDGGMNPHKLAEQIWTTTNSNILDFLEDIDPQRRHQIQFEDLVTNPDEAVQDLCAFLDIPFDPAILSPYEGERMIDGVHDHSMPIGDPNFRTHQGIDASLAEVWKSANLPRRPGRMVRRLAADLDYDLPWPVQSSPEPVKSVETLIPPIQPISQGGPLPLSYSQQRLQFLDQFDPGSAVYNIPTAIRLQGPLNSDVLKRCFFEILRRHESLRTNFIIQDEKPVQIIEPATSFSLPVVDLEAIPEASREAEIRRLADEEARRPFDLSHDLKLRAILLRLGRDDHVLLLTMHHIASDGWSLGVFFREFAALYTAFVSGKPSPLTELPVQYADFAHWQRQRLQGELFETQLAYWERQIGSNAPVLNLQTDRPRPATQTFNGDRCAVEVTSELTASLKKLSRQDGVTLFMMLLASFEALLFRYTGQEDFVIGSPIAGRIRPEIGDLIGFFVNMLPMRADLTGNPTYRQLLQRVRTAALGAYENQEMPFDRLVEELQPARNLSHSPIFQVMFILQNSPMPGLDLLPDLTLSLIDVNSGTAKFDLSFSLSDMDGELTGWLEYNSDLFDRETIERMLGHWQMIITAVVSDPDQNLADLSLLTAREQEQLLVDWNETEIEYPREQMIQQLFEVQVAQTPEKVAVVFEDETLTYRQLNERANQLGRYLQSLGVGAESLVGIYMDRSLEMIVGLMGILKVGGAYVPMDPAFPEERLKYMLADSGAKVMLTQQDLPELGGQPDIQPVYLDRDWAAISQESSENLQSQARPENLAYVIYTSGSTGKPKGVQIQHEGVVSFLTSMRQEPGFTAEDILLSVTTLSFDISVLEIFLPLTTGALLVLVSQETAADGRQLTARLDETKATIMQATPATWSMLVESGWQGNDILKVLCGGEALSRALADQLLARCGSLWNMYGPTETTIWSAVVQVHPDKRSVTIGRPIGNTQFYVLDNSLQPLPVGVPGELLIGGVGLARGYLNRPELTVEKFIPDPFIADPEARLYRTGDLVRYLPDGKIDYLGRFDHQVKIRGFRIELGEIETTLNELPDVRQAVVIVREDVPGDQRLVAYIIYENQQIAEALPTTSELRGYLRERLPDYMIPSNFVSLEHYPQTPNGKIDRRALPVPDQTRPELESVFVAPRTDTEELLADIWCELLGLDQVGIHDDFFELGGHSLMAVQLISRIRTNLNVEIPLKSMFEAPTVAGLANAVTKTKSNQNNKNQLKQLLNRLELLSVDEVQMLLDAEK